MTDAELRELLRPHVARMAQAFRPPAPPPATFSESHEPADGFARPATFYAAAGFSADDAGAVGRYFAADDDGHYPGDVHRYFGLNVRDFADRSKLVRKQIETRTGRRWYWVNPEKGKHAGRDDTPAAPKPDADAEGRHATLDAENAVSKALAAPHELAAEHVEQLAQHLDTLPRDRLRDLAKQVRVKMGSRKAELVQRLLDHVRGRHDPTLAPGAALERGERAKDNRARIDAELAPADREALRPDRTPAPGPAPEPATREPTLQELETGVKPGGGPRAKHLDPLSSPYRVEPPRVVEKPGGRDAVSGPAKEPEKPPAGSIPGPTPGGPDASRESPTPPVEPPKGASTPASPPPNPDEFWRSAAPSPESQTEHDEAYKEFNRLNTRHLRGESSPPPVRKVMHNKRELWEVYDPDTGKGYMSYPTKAEAEKQASSRWGSAVGSQQIDAARERYQKARDQLHRSAVESAIAAGKPVPPEVLQDYPDLAAKYGKAGGAGTGPTPPPKEPGPPEEPPENPSTGVDRATVVGNNTPVASPPDFGGSTGGGKMDAEEFAKLVSTRIMTPAGLEQAKKLVALTAKDSPSLAEYQAALDAAQKRWDSEAPVREAREALRKAGWEKSQYDPNVWYNRKTKAKRTLVEAIRESGVARSASPAVAAPAPAKAAEGGGDAPA